ncbi:MAG: RIP metalloprotease RseP [Candidatus Aminicenantes bacterium]|nr:RIP metalloprotease RseP [Candidatus Aminicenantes bacterium]
MTALYTVLAFAIVLGIIVLVHEFGHYIAARLMGVRVETFSFGFGKRLFGKQVGDTDFRFSLVPLGGYVKMAGEEDYDADPKERKPDEFLAKNRGQKIFILVMGSLMNLVLAYIIFTVINITGVDIEKYKLEPPRIGYVLADSPAAKAGILPGDVIRSINNRKIDAWKDLELNIGASPNETLAVEYDRGGEKRIAAVDVKSISRYNVGDAGLYWDFKTRIDSIKPDSPAFQAGIKEGDIIRAINGQPVCYFEIVGVISPSIGKPLEFEIERDSTVINLTVTPLEEVQEGVKRGVIGVGMTPYSPAVKVQYGLWDAAVKSKNDMTNLTFFIFNAFRKMIAGKISAQQLSGPIEIAKFSQKAMERGPSSLFMLIAFISLQLGLVNLFPIPALDGGHLLLYTIEAIIRKDFSPKVKNILLNAGFALLIALMAFVVLNDIAKLLPRGWATFWPF